VHRPVTGKGSQAATAKTNHTVNHSRKQKKQGMFEHNVWAV